MRHRLSRVRTDWGGQTSTEAFDHIRQHTSVHNRAVRSLAQTIVDKATMPP